MSDAPYNDGYTHEAMHTTYVLMETFSTHVIETRCAAEFPEVKELAERIHGLMFELYQLIGEKAEDRDLIKAQSASDLFDEKKP